MFFFYSKKECILFWNGTLLRIIMHPVTIIYGGRKAGNRWYINYCYYMWNASHQNRYYLRYIYLYISGNVYNYHSIVLRRIIRPISICFRRHHIDQETQVMDTFLLHLTHWMANILKCIFVNVFFIWLKFWFKFVYEGPTLTPLGQVMTWGREGDEPESNDEDHILRRLGITRPWYNDLFCVQWLVKRSGASLEDHSRSHSRRRYQVMASR